MKEKFINAVVATENIETIHMKSVGATGAGITIHIPIQNIEGELETLMFDLQRRFMEKHPDVAEWEICFDARLIYSLDGYLPGIDTDFVLDIYVWKDTDHNVMEFYEYDEIALDLGAEGKQQIKQIIWNALGKILMTL